MNPDLAKSLESVVTAHNALQAARSIGRKEADEAVDNLLQESFELLAAIIGNDDASAVFLHFGDASGDINFPDETTEVSEAERKTQAEFDALPPLQQWFVTFKREWFYKELHKRDETDETPMDMTKAETYAKSRMTRKFGRDWIEHVNKSKEELQILQDKSK